MQFFYLLSTSREYLGITNKINDVPVSIVIHIHRGVIIPHSCVDRKSMHMNSQKILL